MSVKYDEYIEEHIKNVGEAFYWLLTNIPELCDEETWTKAERLTVHMHDGSKYDKAEYDAYDAYFYGGNRSYEVVQDFNKAWLHHIHENPHHWQHWILINDDPENGEIILDMPNEYIIEMISDWWSFSFKKGDLHEIFNWYDEHKDHMKLSDRTRSKVNHTLEMIKKRLNESKENE